MKSGPGKRVRRLLVMLIALLLGLSGWAGLAGLSGLRDPVVPLAKAVGWRQNLGTGPPPFAIVEIAYDEETANRVWEDNVPRGLRERSGDPERAGLYGDLDGVDFDTQVVVVWSSGESSSCPGWLAAIEVDAAGTVRVERDDASGPFGACTDDYNPYRTILAVDRERLPSRDTLPTQDVAGVPDGPGAGGLVTAYPADP